MSEVEIITVSKKGQVVLPKNIRTQLHIHQGSKLLLIQKKDKITLSKVDSLIEKELSEKKFTLLASEKSLAKDWLSKEEEKAWAYL